MASHIKGAKLIPMDEVQDRKDEIDWDKKVIFYCRSGARSLMVAKTMQHQGDNVYNLEGGIELCDPNWEGLEG